jgi:hypothetical protein
MHEYTAYIELCSRLELQLEKLKKENAQLKEDLKRALEAKETTDAKS